MFRLLLLRKFNLPFVFVTAAVVALGMVLLAFIPAQARGITPGDLTPSGLVGATLTEVSCEIAIGIDEGECGRLMALYDAGLRGKGDLRPAWGSTTAPCGWRGISCLNGFITSLTLKGAAGGATVPSALGNIANLTQLSLLEGISGSLPANFGQWFLLKDLTIKNNSITGGLPTLVAVQYLTSLTISGTGISGSLPASYRFGHLFEALDLSHNHLSGNIGNVFLAPYNLRSIDLSHNQFTSMNMNFDDRAGFDSLEEVRLNNNLLDGVYYFGRRISTLRLVDLSHNRIRLGIPNVGPDITHFQINDNPISAEMPISLSIYSELEYFDWSNTAICIPYDFALVAWLRAPSFN